MIAGLYGCSGNQGSNLRIRVFDLANLPIEGAQVKLQDQGRVIVARTGEDGFVEVDGSVRGETFELEVTAEGYFRTIGHHGYAPLIRIPMHRSEFLAGTVRDAETGEGILSTVTLVWHNGICLDCPRTSTQSTEQGDYRFVTAPQESSLFLLFDAEGYRSGLLAVDDDRRIAVNAFLSRWSVIEVYGKVVDSESGVGIPGAQVMDGGGVTITSGSDGAFRGSFRDQFLAGLETHQLTISGPGYLEARFIIEAEQEADSTAIQFPLIREATITGTVLAGNQDPVANATVRLSLAEFPGPGTKVWDRVKDQLHESIRFAGWEHAMADVELTTNAAGEFGSSDLLPWSEDYLDSISLEDRELARYCPIGTGGPGSLRRFKITSNPGRPLAATVVELLD